MIDASILAYVAGLFDGEGSIVIGVSKNKKDRKSPNHWLQVGITNTDKELIDWLFSGFGGHISDNTHSPSRKLQRPCWAWRVMSNEASNFLDMILPYLRIKRRQAILAIEFQTKRAGSARTGNMRTLSEDVILEREWYREEIRSLTLGIHSIK